MIYIDDINRFYSVISDLKASGALVCLYGNSEETYIGAYSGPDTPQNNKLYTRIAALTSAGTIYCNSSIRLTEKDAVENCRSLFRQLNVTNAEVSYSGQNDTVTIK